MVRSQQPAMQECGDPVHARHGLVGWRIGSKAYRPAMLVAKFFEISVGRRSVAVNQRSWSNSLLDERHQTLVVALSNLPDPYPPKSLWVEHFDCNSDQHFAGVTLSANRTDRILAVGDRKVRLIDFDLAMQQISTRPDHSPAQAVQHGPCSFIASKAKNTLQTQCTDAVFLVGDVPNSGEPNAKFSARPVEDGAGRHRCL